MPGRHEPESASLVVERTRSASGGWRHWTVYVDDVIVGSVSNGARLGLDISVGAHTILVRGGVSARCDSNGVEVHIPRGSFVELSVEPKPARTVTGQMRATRPTLRIHRVGPGATATEK